MNYIDPAFAHPSGSSEENVEPFLKWAGGKRWLFRRYQNLFPKKIGRLIDPFIGGGSSFFYLKPATAVLSDLNADLIELYLAIREHPRRISKSLVHYHHAHSVHFFYKARANKPMDPVRRAAWLLYLNRTCWNGLFRVNLRGEFNVPIGTKKTVFMSMNEFDNHSRLLQHSVLLQSDFEAIIDYAKHGDVVFADPPYFENKRNVRFLRYNSNIFSWSDQLRLRDALLRARVRGAICYVTNSNHRSLVDLYRGHGIIHELSRHCVLSGTMEGRKKDKEILVELP
jgi:DNA adenine methylase